jgi:hypothetical protein
VRSHEAEANVVPSGDIASATIGAVWPSNTAVGSADPDRQSAMRPSSPPLTIRPSGASATAFTAL